MKVKVSSASTLPIIVDEEVSKVLGIAPFENGAVAKVIVL